MSQLNNDGPVLEARGITVGYGAGPIVRDLNLTIGRGQVVALLGINGAGKTTTVKALSGQIKPSAGEVWLRGEPTTAPLHQRARRGLRLITEERSVIRGLTTLENLRLGQVDTSKALALFPELERLLHRKAGLLSGGEQQMLTLARAIAAEPVVLVADELSLGLAPLVVARLLVALRAAADQGTGVLLVEQRVRDALQIADQAHVLSGGHIALSGTGREMADRIDEIERTYLAGSELVSGYH